MKPYLTLSTAMIALILAGCEHSPDRMAEAVALQSDPNACEITSPIETARFDAAFETEVDAAMAHMIARGIAPGAVVRIDHGGETVFSKSYGHADTEDDKPMREDSLFRIYSMTKPVTTIAALQLVDAGALELDAPISRYLPDFADIKVATDETGETVRDPSRAPTVRDLMRHTTGLTYRTGARIDPIAAKYAELGIPAGPGVSDPPTNGMAPVIGDAAFIDRITQVPLKHDPGTKFTYGNSTDVLGAVVAAVSGQSLGDHMAENIFEPVGMDDSMFQVPAERFDDFTSAYLVTPQAPSGSPIEFYVPIDDLEPQTPVRLDRHDRSLYALPPAIQYGGAGLVSDADDYLAFTRALMRDGARLISDEIWAEATRDQLSAEARASAAFLGKRGFGLGFAVRDAETRTAPVFPQCGLFWAGAASTYFWIDEETDTSGVLMTQVFEGDVRSYFHEILEAVYGEPD